MEEQQKKNYWFPISIAVGAAFVLLLLILYKEPLNAFIGSLLDLFRPVLIGLVLAYFANSIFRFFERKVFLKVKPSSVRRVLSLLLSYAVICLILVVLLLLILPQLFESIGGFLRNYNEHLETSVDALNSLIFRINTLLPERTGGMAHIPYLKLDEILKSLESFVASLDLSMEDLAAYFTPEAFGSLITVASGLVSLVADIVLGIFISIYLLNRKEKFYAQILRFRRAFFSDSFNRALTRIISTADRSFGSFIKGKLVDSSIVGLLVYLALSLLQVPNALLIAVIVGITDIVPIIGPFVGVVPSGVIILLTEPSKLIPFLLCILVIQQIDGNIIAPKILGENTGVSSLCVMIAITVMGAIWGLAGMVIGVPLFATVGELFSAYLDKRLEKKGLPAETAYYSEDLPMEDAPKREPLLSRLQRRILRLRRQSEDGGRGDLTDRERDQLEIYAAAKRHHILAEDYEGNLAQFAAERASVKAERKEPAEQAETPTAKEAE
ncbi:MAG: AI-2E family transporter [Clostridia bacterium]|nr:AI-2E family transporter [Clostridia bacterium]MBQ2249626.1 AI-2E family transporter [Clostridia bacterium]